MAADLKISVVQFTCPASVGNLDVTDAAVFGGSTPKAVIIFGGAAAANDTETVDARMTIGFGAGANQRCFSSTSLDNLAATDDYSRWYSTNILRAGNATAGFILASLSSFIADGVRLNFSAVTSGRIYTAIIIGGGDVTAFVGSTAPSGTNITTDVNTVGFLADLVLFASCNMNAASATTVNQHGIAFGAALREAAKNYCTGQMERDAQAAGGNPTAVMYDNAVSFWADVSNGVVGYTQACNNFDTSGFDIVTTGTNGGDVLGFLALKLANCRLAAFDFTTKTSTGSQSYVDVGFLPLFGMICASSLTSKNTSAYDVEAASGFSVSGFRSSQAGLAGLRINFSADPSDGAEVTSNTQVLAAPSSTNVLATKAALTSFDALGWTLNYGASAGNALQSWAIAIGNAASPPIQRGVRSAPNVDFRSNVNQFRSYPKL